MKYKKKEENEVNLSKQALKSIKTIFFFKIHAHPLYT